MAVTPGRKPLPEGADDVDYLPGLAPLVERYSHDGYRSTFTTRTSSPVGRNSRWSALCRHQAPRHGSEVSARSVDGQSLVRRQGVENQRMMFVPVVQILQDRKPVVESALPASVGLRTLSECYNADTFDSLYLVVPSFDCIFVRQLRAIEEDGKLRGRAGDSTIAEDKGAPQMIKRVRS